MERELTACPIVKRVVTPLFHNTVELLSVNLAVRVAIRFYSESQQSK
jgi:hypothetical protein